MTLIDVSRALGSACWAIVAITGAAPAWRVFRGRSNGHDDLNRSLFAAFGLMNVFYNGRWYVAPGSDFVYTGLHAFSITLAILTIRAMLFSKATGNG